MLAKNLPWIYNLKDYQDMFALSIEEYKHRKILNYPATVSSFNAELQPLGISVVSADPHYFLQPLDMSARIDTLIQEWSERLTEQAEGQLPKGETWDNILSEWNQRAQQFLVDYSAGKVDGRYKVADCPTLPFADFEFDLLLCPDFLLQCKTPLLEALQELCRVAYEVRVFPLLDSKGQVPDVMGPIITDLQNQNYGIEIRCVPYQRQKEGNTMLRIWAKECLVNGHHG